MRDLPMAVVAAADLQQQGREPTDRALHEAGGPEPHKFQHLLQGTDLSGLPAAQSRVAMDAHLVPVPAALVLEAHTDSTRGPAKAGSIHLQPPPVVETRAPGKARNTEGGIASALALGDADGALLPFGNIQIYQGLWRPANHPAERREEVERALRAFGGVVGSFTRTPDEITHELVKTLGMVDGLKSWAVRLDGLFVCGGRLRIGFPDKSGVVGAGTQQEFLGADLQAIRKLAMAGLVPFLELPHNLHGPSQTAPCDWRFQVSGRRLGLDDFSVEALDPDSEWSTVPREIVDEAGLPGYVARWISTTAYAPAMDLVVLALTNRRGRVELFVTTMKIDSGEDLRTLVSQGATEIRRRNPDSTVTNGVSSLLRDGFLQRQQRRRAPERAGFGAVAQAAFGVLELARHAA
jgi:hypothetical protein